MFCIFAEIFKTKTIMEKTMSVVNPQEFGIEESKANELVGNLPQIQNERVVLEQQYNNVLTMDIESPETSKLAREIRLKIRDNRTKGIAVWHKTTKEVFLRAGQYVDAIKRREEAINERMESALEEIEKYAENKERERLDLLEKQRIEILEPFKEFVPFGVSVRTISGEDFDKLLNGAKLQLQAKKDAERLEAERIEKERIEEEKRIAEEKRLNDLENSRRIELAPFSQFIESIPNLREMENFDEFLNDLKLKKKNHDEEIEAQRIENERLKAEVEKVRIENERIEKERQAELKRLEEKRQAELKAERERIEAENKAKLEAEKLAKAPIKKQMSVWINSFEIPETNLDNEVVKEIKQKFETFKKWSISQTDKF